MTSVQLKPLVEPNQYFLQGYDIGISYETTSFTGTPRFSYTRQGQTLNFVGEEIQTEQTQLGLLATVNLSGTMKATVAGEKIQAEQTQANLMGTVDLSGTLKATGATETLTLLIPTIMVNPFTPSPIQTIAIFNLQSPPIKIPGQSQTYMTVYLSGTANQIDF
jgi:hypothetical protein